MSNLSKAISVMKKNERQDSIEVATITNLSPFTIKIDSHEYDAINFTIFAPLPMKIEEKQKTEVIQKNALYPVIGETRYAQYNLEEVFDTNKTMPFEVGQLVSVVDKGNTFIVLAVLCDMKGGVKI